MVACTPASDPIDLFHSLAAGGHSRCLGQKSRSLKFHANLTAALMPMRVLCDKNHIVLCLVAIIQEP